MGQTPFFNWNLTPSNETASVWAPASSQEQHCEQERRQGVDVETSSCAPPVNAGKQKQIIYSALIWQKHAKAKQKQVGKKPMRSSCQVFLQHYKSLECYGVWMCLAWDIGFTDAASTRVAPTRSRPHRLLPKQLGPSIRKIRRSIEMRIEMDQSMRINQYG